MKWDTQSSEEIVFTRKKCDFGTKCSLKLDILKKLLNYFNGKPWAK